MRSLVTLLAVLATSSASAAPVRGLRPADELRLVFLAADQGSVLTQGMTGDASIHVGRISARCKAGGCARAVIRKSFRLRVDGAGSGRFVRVRAFVQAGGQGKRYFLDGRPLSTVPMVVDAAAPVRVAVAHTLEIEVSAAEPDGMLAETIGWQVEEIR